MCTRACEELDELALEGMIAHEIVNVRDGESAVAATLRHRPDVLVIDLEMPGVDGLGAVAEIRRELPDQVILMLTRHARPGVLRRALKLGVQGFVSKSAEPAHITTVIETLRAGKRWVDPDVSALAVLDDNPLTDREVDVLRATGEGYSASDIASRLHLAEGTVRNYLSEAISKLGAANRVDAARIARRKGWL